MVDEGSLPRSRFGVHQRLELGMPPQPKIMGEGIVRAVHEVPGHDSTIEGRLQLGAASIDYPPPRRSRMTGVNVVDLAGNMLVATDELIVPIGQILLEDQPSPQTDTSARVRR